MTVFIIMKKKGAAHKCYKSLGSVETLKKNGMEDPISFYQQEVDFLNQQRKEEGVRKISDISPTLYLGYFPLKAILEKLKIQRYVNYFHLTYDFQFDLYELISTLVYARGVCPCSKNRTFHDVLPNLYHSSHYSYDQLLDGLAFLGENYEKFVEIFTVQTAAVYGLDTSNSYFDCTNFYFEIDREDDFRKKGPSKENKKEPIIGLGLLLDRNQIPVGMKMYPGNESEKPILRDVIDGLKNRNNITGKTIHVAGKGLNCAQNIAFSKQNGDGYLFSKSVKTLPSTEKTWVLSEQDYKDVKDKRNDFGEAGKYVDFTDKTGNKAKTRMNRAAIDKDLALAGYNLLVTSETQMTDQYIYCTYHNLWRIEESFKIMKSDLDARPVFLQKENTIKGHFLICYLTVLLERIFQFKILDEKYSISDIFRFIKDFRVTKGEYKYINTIFDYKL